MDGFVSVAKVSDFREGKIRRYFLQGKEIAVALWQERWYAFSNRCTHNDFQLHFGFIEDGCIHCPIHYGVYDLKTGAAKSGPVTHLAVYAVRVQDEDVQVWVERPSDRQHDRHA